MPYIENFGTIRITVVNMESGANYSHFDARGATKQSSEVLENISSEKIQWGLLVLNEKLSA